jgi:hypothetical protein
MNERKLYILFQTIPLWRLIYEMLYFDSNKAKQEFDQIPKGIFLFFSVY